MQLIYLTCEQTDNAHLALSELFWDNNKNSKSTKKIVPCSQREN